MAVLSRFESRRAAKRWAALLAGMLAEPACPFLQPLQSQASAGSESSEAASPLAPLPGALRLCAGVAELCIVCQHIMLAYGQGTTCKEGLCRRSLSSFNLAPVHHSMYPLFAYSCRPEHQGGGDAAPAHQRAQDRGHVQLCERRGGAARRAEQVRRRGRGEEGGERRVAEVQEEGGEGSWGGQAEAALHVCAQPYCC